MKQKLVTFMLALLATTALFAQNKVTGKVSDDQGPAIGVSVMEKGTNNGVITDLDGNYVITVKPGATLVFSSIGYANQEIVVGSQSVINVLLKEDAEFLDEVVVVGYGTMKRSDLSGSSVSMKEEDLNGLHHHQPGPVPAGPCSRCYRCADFRCSWFQLLHPRSWSGHRQRQRRTSVRD